MKVGDTMYKNLIGLEVNVIVSSKSENLLEYQGILEKEDETTIVLKNANISYLMLNFQKGFFGNNLGQYKTDIDEVIINKRYIISCNK